MIIIHNNCRKSIEASYLLKYCKTEHQKKILQKYIENKEDLNKTSKSLKLNKNIIKKVLSRIVRYYKKDLDKCCNNPYSNDNELEKSSSVLYNKDGNVVLKWIKKDNRLNRIKEVQKKYIDEYSKDIPKYISKKNTKNKFEDKLVVYPIADVHIGMMSWFQETGNDYNTKTADKLLRSCITKIMDRSPSCKECLIANLGDFLHIDNAVNKTERSGNILDCDGRYGKIMQIAIKLMRYIIEYSLQKHSKITVICCKGNHDDLGQLWLSSALSNIYENEKRLKIISNFSTRVYYRYGNSLIGCTHGNDIPDKNLPIIMASEKRDEWGKTKYHYWYCGHWHTNKVMEICDCKIEAFNAFCGKDAWSHSKGYLAPRNLKAIFIDPEFGETERYTLDI